MFKLHEKRSWSIEAQVSSSVYWVRKETTKVVQT